MTILDTNGRAGLNAGDTIEVRFDYDANFAINDVLLVATGIFGGGVQLPEEYTELAVSRAEVVDVPAAPCHEPVRPRHSGRPRRQRSDGHPDRGADRAAGSAWAPSSSTWAWRVRPRGRPQAADLAALAGGQDLPEPTRLPKPLPDSVPKKVMRATTNTSTNARGRQV